MSAAAGAGDAQYRKMTQTPIPRLVATLAVPTIISMLVTAVYNMADTFFVAQLGTSAAGAVGIVFSLMAFKGTCNDNGSNFSGWKSKHESGAYGGNC